MNEELKKVCRDYYDEGTITPKELTNLILGNNPKGQLLSYRHHGYQSVIEKITYKFKCNPKTKLDSKQAFEWAILEIKDFQPDLPVRSKLKANPMQLGFAAIGIDLPKSDELAEEHIKKQALIIMEKTTENEQLKKEIERLSVFEKKDKSE